MILSIYTPTFRRPTYLRMCRESVERQSVPVQHIIISDVVGIGTGGMYFDIRNHVDSISGDYVLFLCDDNVLMDRYVAEDFCQAAESNGMPEVIIWKGKLSSLRETLPYPWGERPHISQIDLCSFVVRSDIWKRNANMWRDDADGAADFWFVDGLWESGCRFFWFDRLAHLALNVMYGQPEVMHG